MAVFDVGTRGDEVRASEPMSMAILRSHLPILRIAGALFGGAAMLHVVLGWLSS